MGLSPGPGLVQCPTKLILSWMQCNRPISNLDIATVQSKARGDWPRTGLSLEHHRGGGSPHERTRQCIRTASITSRPSQARPAATSISTPAMLGLRLVKKTVNFDDPGTYHFYYGDEAGQPGTILTFFPWEHAAPGRLGVGETQETVFRVPEGAIGYWTHRFVEKGVPHEAPRSASARPCSRSRIRTACGWRSSPCRASRRARVERRRDPGRARDPRLPQRQPAAGEAAPTGAILTDIFGFTEVAREGSVIRYKTGDTALGGIIDCARQGIPAWPAGRRHGPPHRVPRRQRRRAGRDGREAGREPRHPRPRSRRTETTSGPSTSASPTACCSRSPPTIRALPSTSRPSRSGRGLKLPRFLEPKREQIEAMLPKSPDPGSLPRCLPRPGRGHFIPN